MLSIILKWLYSQKETRKRGPLPRLIQNGTCGCLAQASWCLHKKMCANDPHLILSSFLERVPGTATRDGLWHPHPPRHFGLQDQLETMLRQRWISLPWWCSRKCERPFRTKHMATLVKLSQLQFESWHSPLEQNLRPTGQTTKTTWELSGPLATLLAGVAPEGVASLFRFEFWQDFRCKGVSPHS